MRRCVSEEAARLLGAETKPTGVRVLGLDEFALRKGQIYDTAISDIEHKAVLGVVSGHRQAEVAAFFEGLTNPEAVEVVATDMHEPFRQAVEMCLPQAKVVVDKFHVVRQVNRALDQVRVCLQAREYQGRRGGLFKGRYLLLKAVENLTPEEAGQLTMLLGAYPELRRASG